MTKRLILALLLAAVGGAGTAQTVWRCGADGSLFQATPCAEGRRLALRSAPPAAAVKEAQAVTRRERRALQTLAGERRLRESEALERGLGPAAIRPLPKAPDRPPKPRLPKAPPWLLAPPAA